MKRIKRAFAMITVLAILSIVAALTVVVGLSVNTSLRTNTQDDLKRKARYAAYAGTQRALLDIKNNPTNTVDQFPYYVDVQLPNDPNTSYSVNVISNLNPPFYIPPAYPIVYAPDTTPVVPGMVYIQASAKSYGQNLSGQSTLASMGKTGQVLWDLGARLTYGVYLTDTCYVDVNNTTVHADTDGPGSHHNATAANGLVTITDNQKIDQIGIDGQGTIYGNVQMPFEAPTGPTSVNTSGRTGSPPGQLAQATPYLGGPPPNTAAPRNGVPKFGAPSSLAFSGFFPAANPLPGSPTLSQDTVYSSLSADYLGAPSNVLTLPNLPKGVIGVKGDINLNCVNMVVPTGANALFFMRGHCNITNSTINWSQAPSPAATHNPLALQFYGITKGTSGAGKIMRFSNCTVDTVIGGRNLDVLLQNNTIMVGAVMAHGLNLTGNATLHYDITPLVTAPVQAPMLVDVMGQKADRSGGQAFTYTCFVATAAYGDINHPSVVALRAFRDDVMLQSSVGRLLVNTYYRVSPPLANVIAGSGVLRMMAQTALAPIVFAVQHLEMAGLGLLFGLSVLVLCWRPFFRLAYFGLTGRDLALRKADIAAVPTNMA